MSECLPDENLSLILDLPNSPQQLHTLRLIETNNHLPPPSLLSLASLDKDHPQATQLLLVPLL